MSVDAEEYEHMRAVVNALEKSNILLSEIIHLLKKEKENVQAQLDAG